MPGLDDTATLVVGAGNFFTAPASTAFPADLKAVSVPWTNIGHTSLDDIFSADSDGGDATTLGTLQAPQLRTTYEALTQSFNVNLQQWDEAGLKLYHGSNATMDDKTGLLHVPTKGAPTIAAFLAVFLDNANSFCFFAPKAEIFRADNVSIDDTTSLASLPLKVTPVQVAGNDWSYAVTPLSYVKSGH